MPIVEDPVEPPVAPPPPGNIPATIFGPEYRHSLVDIKVTPLTSIITHLSGSSWTVDYYSQVLGLDEEPTPYQPGQQGTYQSYLLVHNYDLKLQGSLTPVQNEETTEWNLTGTARIYPGSMIPNFGDAFIADIGDGQAGMFSVTRVVKKAMFTETAWEVDFTMTRMMDQVLQDELATRVVKEAYFQKDFLTYGQDPVLISTEVENKNKIETYLATLFNKWIIANFSREYKTLLVPKQVIPTYDPFLVSAVLSIYNRTDHPLLSKIREINCDGERLMNQLNFWYAITHLDPSVRTVYAQKMWLIDSDNFARHPQFESVAFSGIRQVVYPNIVDESVDKDYSSMPDLTGTGYTDPGDYNVSLESLFIVNVPGGFENPLDPDLVPSVTDEEIPYVHPVTIDDYYVFSEFFYTQASTGQSGLELMTNDMISGNAINLQKLFLLCDDIKNWGALERFYYIPVLLILLKVSLRKL